MRSCVGSSWNGRSAAEKAPKLLAEDAGLGFLSFRATLGLNSLLEPLWGIKALSYFRVLRDLRLRTLEFSEMSEF